MLIGGNGGEFLSSAFFFSVDLPIFNPVFWLFYPSNVNARFFLSWCFSPFYVVISRKNCILVYNAEKKKKKKGGSEVINSKQLFTVPPYTTRNGQCWFYFSEYAFRHALLRFGSKKNGRALLFNFFSWGCKVLNCPA